MYLIQGFPEGFPSHDHNVITPLGDSSTRRVRNGIRPSAPPRPALKRQHHCAGSGAQGDSGNSHRFPSRFSATDPQGVRIQVHRSTRQPLCSGPAGAQALRSTGSSTRARCLAPEGHAAALHQQLRRDQGCPLRPVLARAVPALCPAGSTTRDRRQLPSEPLAQLHQLQPAQGLPLRPSPAQAVPGAMPHRQRRPGPVRGPCESSRRAPPAPPDPGPSATPITYPGGPRCSAPPAAPPGIGLHGGPKASHSVGPITALREQF